MPLYKEEKSKPIKASIVGCVGLPARYGGFETLAANLVAYRDAHDLFCELTVYCSAKAYDERPDRYGGARLRYLPLNANGASSIAYDALSILQSIRRRDDVILVLGVSGAIILPIARLLSRARLVVNIDGLEWKRPKWSRPVAWFLKISERIAVRTAHVIVADNRGIVDHVAATYGRTAVEIPYGGDHAVALPSSISGGLETDTPYALMLCRIEPENHIHVILDAFARSGTLNLVAVGNWASSDYGRALKERYTGTSSIDILDSVFDKQALADLRAGASLYVHGHSAGGTNPALVEMMHFGTSVIAFDCNYNRHTTENGALYFTDTDDLIALLDQWPELDGATNGDRMRNIAQRRYTWDIVGHLYFAAINVRE